MPDTEKIMRELIQLARVKQTPYTSVILNPDGKVLAKEPNRVSEEGDATSHAEINAIRTASQNAGTKDLSGCHLITTCEPCPMCAAAIYWSGIRKVTYGLSIPEIVKAGHKQLSGRLKDVTEAGKNGIEITGGVLASDVRELFG